MFKFLGLTFHWYGLLIGVGIYAAYKCSLWLAGQRQVEKKQIEALAVWVVTAGIIGARIYHVIDYWERYYSLYPIKVLFVWEGGLGIWGAILGGVMGLVGYWLVVKFTFFNLLDIVFFGLPLAQAIGRWGNFFNQELVGKNGEPLFLYESVLDLALFGVLWIYIRTHPAGSGKRPFSKPGTITGIYLLGYGLIRFFLEPMRPKEMIWTMAGYPVAQALALVAVLAGTSAILRASSKR